MERNITLFIYSLLLGILSVTQAPAQNPVRFSVSERRVSAEEVDVVFTGAIERGWHVYSTDLPKGGPTAATLTVEEASGAEPQGALKAEGHEINRYDRLFGMDVRYFEGSVSFVQRFRLTGGDYLIKGFLEYGACDDEMCMPPTSVEFGFTGQGPDAKAEEKQDSPAEETAELPQDSVPVAVQDSVALPADSVLTDSVSTDQQALWLPVVKELEAFGGDTTKGKSLWWIFLMGLLGGLLALFTPCVWPIIPMTVSFFLKRTKDRSKAVRDALTYGASIVVIYLTLGLLVTALFGANKLNDLATNAVFNIFFFLLLVVFALSFFGLFELRLPSSWGNAVDTKAEKTTGLLSIFLMAFTLALVSFSCTGPIVGFLLVDFATSGSIKAPAVGMAGFALALALPFTLFALFPSWLKQAPKSGRWMNTIKVVLGFIELAFSLKFLSVADLAYGWGILSREVFLVLWIIIFILMGLYLLGVYQFPSDKVAGEKGKMPWPCVALGLVSLAFALYLVPGLWGAPCKAVSAFSPPMSTQRINLYKSTEVRAAYTDYEEGMAAAARTGKPVLLDFTGFGCVNCRKMEAAVWTDRRVADKLQHDFVLISLFVDDKTPLKEKIRVTVGGQQRTLRTVGDKWSYLEQVKFGAVAQPFYVCVDTNGRPLNKAFVYKEDADAYLRWLVGALERSKLQ